MAFTSMRFRSQVLLFSCLSHALSNAVQPVFASSDSKPKVGGYTNELGEWAVKMAAIAYCPPPDSKGFFDGGFVKVETIPTAWVTPEGVKLADDDDLEEVVVVAFTGTNPLHLDEVISDLQAWSSETEHHECKGGKVHTGFSLAWDKVEKKVLELVASSVQDYIDAGRYPPKIVVTGHSLGGGVSTHATLSLFLHGFRPSLLITFGAPRAGNAAFALCVRNAVDISYRVTHRRDPVPRIPFKEWNYSHIPTEKYYGLDDGETFVHCDDQNKGKEKENETAMSKRFLRTFGLIRFIESEKERVESEQLVEDQKCSDQFKNIVVNLANLPDHLHYCKTDFIKNWADCERKAVELDLSYKAEIFKKDNKEVKVEETDVKAIEKGEDGEEKVGEMHLAQEQEL